MGAQRLKAALAERRPLFGLFCSTPAPIVVEMIGYAGFDFVIIDSEHTLINPETLEQMIRAAEVTGLAPLVRIGELTAGAILRALDAGAQGVVVPRVRGAEEARLAARASRYHPHGERGLGAGRAARFGAGDLPAYLEQANEEVLVVAMIEDRQGVEQIEAISATEGIDLILEGAADLSQSLGVPWQSRHPAVRDALCRVQEQAGKQGVPFCAIPRLPEDLPFWWRRGVRAFVLGDERGIAFRALQAQLRRFRQEIPELREAGA